MPDPSSELPPRAGSLRRIVLATDLGDDGPELFAHGLALARVSRAELVLVHILEHEAANADWKRLPTVRVMLERWGALPPDASHEAFEALGIRVRPLDFAPTDGDLTAAVSRRVADLQPDLLILGTHARHGFDRLVQPSVAEPVSQSAQRATLFLPRESAGFVNAGTGEIGVQRVMVPLSSEVPQQPLLDALARLLGAFQVGECQFTFVHVGNDDDLPSPSLPSRLDWSWRTDRRHGSVVEQILQAEVEHQPHLIAMATEGRHGLWDALAGSTTERVLRRTRTPLLAVPAR